MKNNVHVSGVVQKKQIVSPDLIRLTINADKIGGGLPITIWVRSGCLQNYSLNVNLDDSISVSGNLENSYSGNCDHLVISCKSNMITKYRDLLKEDGEQYKTTFCGEVILKKKFEFNTDAHMYLKRLVFETVQVGSEKPITFEAVALRNAATYFDNIKEGSKMLLRAELVKDKTGKQPYWRVRHKPEILEETQN